MACNCETYECIEVFWSCDSEGAQITIESTETGVWSADIYFNDMPTRFSFGVTDGENIIIPTEFLNEYYTHEFRLYNGAGTLVGCYHLKSRMVNNAGEFIPIPPYPDQPSAKTFDGNGTDTQTFPGIGDPIFRISIGNQVYLQEFTQVGETITMDDGVLFFGKIVIEWENS